MTGVQTCALRSATVSNNWLNLSLASGSLAEGNSVNITLVTNALTAALVGGLYSNAVSFVNLTNGVGNTSRIWEQLVRDGIPDAWRLQYFGHIDPRADDLSRAADDPDGDGFTNIQEYIAGTDPKDLSSRFRVIDISRAANGTVTLTWSAVATKTYRAQYKDDVTAITWTDLAGDVNATGATASKADSTASGTKRIYQIGRAHV